MRLSAARLGSHCADSAYTSSTSLPLFPPSLAAKASNESPADSINCLSCERARLACMRVSSWPSESRLSVTRSILSDVGPCSAAKITIRVRQAGTLATRWRIHSVTFCQGWRSGSTIHSVRCCTTLQRPPTCQSQFRNPPASLGPCWLHRVAAISDATLLRTLGPFCADISRSALMNR